MLAGPNVESTKEFSAEVSVPVIASGGVTTIDDVSRLAALDITGAIVGRTLYEGKMNLHDAISAAKGKATKV